MPTRWYLAVLALAGGPLALAADVAAVRQQLRAAAPGVQFYHDQGALTRVFGVPMSFGATPELSAQAFLDQYAGLFHVAAEELFPGNDFNGELTTGMMWDAQAERYGGTLVYYSQYRDGIPVYKADVRLIAANQPGHPLIWVGSGLRDVGAFHVTPDMLAAVNPGAGQTAALAVHPDLVNFDEPRLVVWTGLHGAKAEPALAYAFTADNGLYATAEYEKFTFVTDAVRGGLLHEESEILHVDVTGTVSGMSTTIPKADICNPEVSTRLKYAKVSIGATSAFADANGAFTIPNPGTTSVSVLSKLEGRWFRVVNQAAADSQITQNVTPPGPAAIVHNNANTSATYRAEVNAYVQSNVVRDFALTQDPNYPTIKTQQNFPANVNINSACNAFYDGSSINFFVSAGGCANTSYSSVVHHEYGHHLVNRGGSGQGQYGEGMSDCMSVLITDNPVLGFGFQLNCNVGLRSALTFKTYPCTGQIHDCGQLLSGCVWGVRQALALTEPNEALAITSKLTVNSIKMHTPASNNKITPQIAIDFLTLDDLLPGGDANIANGTPHYAAICPPFAARNMPCPPIQGGLKVTPTTELDVFGNPGGPFDPTGTTFTLKNLGGGVFDYAVTSNRSWLTVTNGSGNLVNNATTTVDVSINANANALTNGTYTGTVTFTNLTSGEGDTTRTVTLRIGGQKPVFTWNLDTNPGWATTGTWAWGTPTGNSGTFGGPDPTSGYTGTRVYAYNLAGGYEDDMIERTLTTTPINCADLTETRLRFRRWLGVEQNLYDHAYVRISNNGVDWITLWQNSDETLDDQGWVLQDFDIAAFADNQPAVRLRWVMGTTDGGWTYCGWNLDDIEIWAVRPETTCPGDADGNGVVNQDDVDLVLFNFGTNQPAGTNGDLDGDGDVDQDDVDTVLFNFGNACP